MINHPSRPCSYQGIGVELRGHSNGVNQDNDHKHALQVHALFLLQVLIRTWRVILL